MAEEEHRVLLQGLKLAGLQFLFKKEDGVGIGGVKGVDNIQGDFFYWSSHNQA